jgi:hypothetical protein
MRVQTILGKPVQEGYAAFTAPYPHSKTYAGFFIGEYFVVREEFLIPEEIPDDYPDYKPLRHRKHSEETKMKMCASYHRKKKAGN